MDIRVIFVSLLLVLMMYSVHADFFFNRVSPKAEALSELNLKCIPGRTVIKVEQIKEVVEEASDEVPTDEIAGDARKSHMNFEAKDELCSVCVCSAEGKDEYCSKRPAKNVNECMRMANLMNQFQKDVPYDHERSLSHRIRRDYLWHNDEIPYEANAVCRRGYSYYTNNAYATVDDIDLPSDIESLLDYSNRRVCYYCVCSVDGKSTGCIQRDSWYCSYYRHFRDYDTSDSLYRNMFKQDRPTYFKEISYRIRRTMDDGLNSLIKSGGDALCCGHPNGHRRNLQNHVRNMVRQLRKRVPKENLLSGGPGGDYVDFIVNND